ncbi:hypothetical protein Klosneuvirus_3_287 [Klosneuvirus KNV1]|uniref:DUF559 domain-containing protein n=1 Tax=Klosneuvirus KNV1 TaxID=1977640 RepID=A0A1V0SKB1_9VIRU|nr:hypothetical protein Klosneuvirus_3_287 [Klosneuvirus KNV1]
MNIHNNDTQLFIEYDGQQHFKVIKKWGGEERFKQCQKHDEIKNNFCQQNNYPLLRIKYTQNKQIDQLVLDFIKQHTNLIP